MKDNADAYYDKTNFESEVYEKAMIGQQRAAVKWNCSLPKVLVNVPSTLTFGLNNRFLSLASILCNILIHEKIVWAHICYFFFSYFLLWGCVHCTSLAEGLWVHQNYGDMYTYFWQYLICLNLYSCVIYFNLHKSDSRTIAFSWQHCLFRGLWQLYWLMASFCNHVNCIFSNVQFFVS